MWLSFKSSIEDELILRDKTVINVRRRSGLPIARATVEPCIPDLTVELGAICLPECDRRKIKWTQCVHKEFASAAAECLKVTNEVIGGTITDGDASTRLCINSLFSKETKPVANYLLQQIYNSAHFLRARGVPSGWNLYRAGKSLAMHCGKIAHVTKEWSDDQ
jgi:hypothetical protein